MYAFVKNIHKALSVQENKPKKIYSSLETLKHHPELFAEINISSFSVLRDLLKLVNISALIA
jgi:hypothetical protein